MYRYKYLVLFLFTNNKGLSFVSVKQCWEKYALEKKIYTKFEFYRKIVFKIFWFFINVTEFSMISNLWYEQRYSIDKNFLQMKLF